MANAEQHQRVTRDDSNDPDTLTFQQRSYLDIHRGRHLLRRLDGATAVRLSGPLNLEVLRRTLENLIERHDALRSRIILSGGTLVHRVYEPERYQLEILQLPGSCSDRSEEIQRLLADLAEIDMDWSGGPLFSAKLLVSSDNEHILYWGDHHLISDQFTRMLLHSQLWNTYDALHSGRPAPLYCRAMQFSTYRQWQREAYRIWQLRHQAFWERRLTGATGIRWPNGLDNAGTTSGDTSLAKVAFSAELSSGLRIQTTKTHTLLSTTMLALYVAVVSRWCKQTDFVVATTVSGRDSVEHRYTAGFLAHIVYLRIQLPEEITLFGLVSLVNKEYYRTLLRKDFGNLAIEYHELSGGTLFQWMPGDEYDTYAQRDRPAPRIVECWSAIDPRRYLASKDKLMLLLSYVDQCVSCSAIYRTSCFSADAISRFVADFKSIAAHFVETPHTPVSRLPVA